MRSLVFAAVVCFISQPVLSADHMQMCKEAKELALITEQVPDHKLSSELETAAKLIPPMLFKPFGVLSASRGSPVCIAVVVSETGAVQDAAAYYPKRVALSSSERRLLLKQKYSPAMQGDKPVSSIVILTASSD